MKRGAGAFRPGLPFPNTTVGNKGSVSQYAGGRELGCSFRFVIFQDVMDLLLLKLTLALLPPLQLPLTVRRVYACVVATGLSFDVLAVRGVWALHSESVSRYVF